MSSDCAFFQVNDEQKPFEKLFEWSGEEAITVQLRNAIRDGIHLELCASFPGQEDGSSEKVTFLAKSSLPVEYNTWLILLDLSVTGVAENGGLMCDSDGFIPRWNRVPLR